MPGAISRRARPKGSSTTTKRRGSSGRGLPGAATGRPARSAIRSAAMRGVRHASGAAPASSQAPRSAG